MEGQGHQVARNWCWKAIISPGDRSTSSCCSPQKSFRKELKFNIDFAHLHFWCLKGYEIRCWLRVRINRAYSLEDRK